MKCKRIIFITLLVLIILPGFRTGFTLSAQAVPGKEENIPFLVTFGKDAETSWGDDDFRQVFFFTIPREYTGRFYIRVFDPDVGGEHDEIRGDFDTRTFFGVYGGKGVDPDKNQQSRGLSKGDNYREGTLLASRVFGSEARYDNKWFSFGPFNPTAGDFNEKWNSYIFKMVVEGLNGDDGNLYRFFMSREAESNLPVEGGNAFTYKYTFRMWNDFKSVAHIYPYVDSGVVWIKQRNFDWDNDGHILVVSRYKQGISLSVSNENEWKEDRIPIEAPEIGSSLDFQFHKAQGELIKNNNVVVTLESQRGDALPFFSSPIGGVPVYNPKITVRKAVKPK